MLQVGPRLTLVLTRVSLNRLNGARRLPSGPRLVDRRQAALRGLVFIVGKPLGQLRDLLLLLSDDLL